MSDARLPAGNASLKALAFTAPIHGNGPLQASEGRALIIVPEAGCGNGGLYGTDLKVISRIVYAVNEVRGWTVLEQWLKPVVDVCQCVGK
ncbi:hypothetical protein GOP47_0031241 [Adiantum capillus-veneris]|nr:hypothetical protein GOP47_0031241 [Adiantum capillus-veneris]